MEDTGKIQGRRLVDLFNYLIEKRVIISMYVAGTDFERLTCVTGVEEDPSGHRLRIDLPDGFRGAVAQPEAATIRFNFNGPDRLEYIFSTQGVHYRGRELETPFPDFVERIQRRKDFRMQTPSGTRMLIKQDKIHAILDLINISMGGAFGAMKKHNLKNSSGPIFVVDQSIRHAGIIVPEDKERPEQVIIIKRCEVRRIEHDRPKHRYRYAFEFMELDASEKRKLTQSIYHFQRQFLQRR